MLIHYLLDYYDKMVKMGVAPEEGWEGPSPIDYRININKDGDLVSIIPCTVDDGEKKYHETMFIPKRVIRTGSNVRPNYFVDTKEYLLGIGDDVMAKEKYRLMAKLHLDLLEDACDSEYAEALCNFFKKWDVEKANSHPLIAGNKDLLKCKAKCVYSVEGVVVTFDYTCHQLYNDAFKKIPEDKLVKTDIVTGQPGPICTTHAKIDNFGGPAKPVLCCLNGTRSCVSEFGGDQGYSTPMSEDTVAKYSVALSYLLRNCNAKDFVNNINILCWTVDESPGAEHAQTVMDFLMSGKSLDEMPATDTDVKKCIESVYAGKMPDIGWVENNAKFIVAGLDSRNGYIVRVKFVKENNLSDLLKGFVDYNNNVALVGYNGSVQSPPLWKTIRSVIKQKKDKSYDDPGKISTMCKLAIIDGTKYPVQLVDEILQRIAVETKSSDDNTRKYAVSTERVGYLKAYLIRNKGEVLTVALDENNKNIGYLCGRLFAQMANVQYAMMGDVNRGIEQNMAEAMTYPNNIIPTLMADTATTIRRLKNSGKVGTAVHFDKSISAIVDLMEDKIPRRFSRDEKCEFVLGYHQQKNKNFTKKAEMADTAEKEEN